LRRLGRIYRRPGSGYQLFFRFCFLKANLSNLFQEGSLMASKCRPVFFLLLAATISVPPAFAQGLPATNMGKFVHQPGDNQYQPSSQLLRHGTEGYLDNTGCVDNRAAVQRQAAAAASVAMPAYTLAPPPPPGPDVSVEPIVAEEPVPPPGFPPLPIALDLPVSTGYSAVSTGKGKWKNESGDGGGGGGGGGSGGGYQGSKGGMAGAKGYSHFEPGAFVPRKNNMGGGGGGDSGGGGADEGGDDGGPKSFTAPAISGGGGGNEPVRSGYKCRTPPPIMRTDTFSSSSGGTSKQAGSAPTNVGGRGGGGPGGKAPALDDAQDTAGGAPDVPTATGVFQTKSEDLTLPDDENTSRYFKDGRAGRMAKQYLKRGKSMGRQMLRQTGVPIGF
jgi:hypothetical protein